MAKINGRLSMLSLETETLLADLFAKIAEGERDVESSRLALCELYNFDVFSAFRRLDRLGLNSLNSLDIKEWLDRAKVFCSEHEAYLLLRQYDADSDGRLILQEFFQLVLPSTRPSLRQLVLERASQPLSLEVEFALNRLLEKEIALQRELEYSQKQLRLKPDFDIAGAFRQIDVLSSNFIDREQLQAFLRRNGVASFPDNIDAIFRRLDNDGDGKLNYIEFVEATLASEDRQRSSRLDRSYRPYSSFRVSSPLRSSLRSPVRASPFQASASLSSSLRSPLRSSLRSSLRTSTPLRTSHLRESLPSRVNLRLSSPLRSSTSLRISSPLRLSSDYTSSLLRRSVSPRSRNSLAFSPAKTYLPATRRSPLISSYSASLREEDQTELVLAFKEQIRLARDLDNAKNDLALRADFNLEDAYRMFDLEDKGYVSLAEFEETLEGLGLRPIRDEVSLLFKHYSTYSDIRLTIREFNDLLMPNTTDYARLIRSRLPYNVSVRERRRVFSYETTGRLLRTLRITLDAEKVAESLRQRLQRLPNFNLYDAFQAVDTGKDGYITLNEFRYVLENHGVYATQKDLEGLMERYDKNKDGRVSYSEFVQEVSPKSPQKY